MRASKESEKDEIASFWRDASRLPPLPEYLYMAVKGFSLHSMGLKRLRCHGENHGPANRFGNGPYWIGTFDKLLWAGKRFTERNTEPDRRYCYSKKNIDLTLEAALQRLYDYAAGYEAEMVHYKDQLAIRERELREQRERVIQDLHEAETFTLRMKDLKL